MSVRRCDEPVTWSPTKLLATSSLSEMSCSGWKSCSIAHQTSLMMVGSRSTLKYAILFVVYQMKTHTHTWPLTLKYAILFDWLVCLKMQFDWAYFHSHYLEKLRGGFIRLKTTVLRLWMKWLYNSSKHIFILYIRLICCILNTLTNISFNTIFTMILIINLSTD